MKSLGATIETTFRNQQASVVNIENQVGQISKVIQENFPWTQPSYTETNPKKTKT